MFFRFDADEERLGGMLAAGDPDGVLSEAGSLMRDVKDRPGALGRALYVPGMDELVRQAGRHVCAGVPVPRGPAARDVRDVIVHVATEVYPLGGHTRVIEDVARVLPEFRHVLALTDAFDSYRAGRLSLGPLEGRFGAARIETRLLSAGGAAGRCVELARLVGDAAPRAVVLMAHPEDAVAYGAIHGGGGGPVVVYCHHCDHFPSLGAARTDYLHADLGPACHEACRSGGVVAPSFLGLAAPARPARPTPPRPAGHPPTAATAGSWHKFAGRDGFDYAELLGALFDAGLARLYHVGPVPEGAGRSLAEGLAARGHDPGGLVFVPPVPSLADTLASLDPDFYLVSHPVGGSKAIVEAMSVGLPVVNPRPACASALTRDDLSAGGAVTVATLADVPAALARVTRDRSALARQARGRFESTFTEVQFRRRLLDLLGAAR